MRFEAIKIPETATKKKGIEEINIQRLSNVVALVGKNGSGKSRILDLIEDHLFNTIDVPSIICDNSISHLPKKLESLQMELQPFKDYFILLEKIKETKLKVKQNPSIELSKELITLQNQILNFRNSNKDQLGNLVQQANSIISTLKLNHLRRIRYNEIRELQQAIGGTQQQDDTLSFENLIENLIENVNYDELKSIQKSALKFLSKLPHQLAYDQYDCIANNKEFRDRISYKRFQALKKYIKDFIDKDLTWKPKTSDANLTEIGNHVTFTGVWEINERPFNYAEFSDGEKTLFAYAVLFFLLNQNPKLSIKESVILIDEPELHLHPDSEIDLIEGIKKAIGEKGQLIIATHSINILSMLNYDEIFMVKNGAITHPSQVTPGKSLSELMGIEERVNKMTDFLSSISTWTYVNFMAQCFTDPEVIQSSKAEDPQVEAFKKAVRENSSKSTNMLLDFGAGKGRLIEQIKSDYTFIDKINYSALEPEVSFHSRLSQLGASNIYTNYSDLPSNTFDFILLCNVLHEIPLDEWEESLNKIISSLKPGGHLIIIEAKVLNRGEKIGKIGYLLLDVEELQKLFKLKSVPLSLMVKGIKESIVCAVIRSTELTNISRKNIIDTLEALEMNTLTKIEAIRENEYESKELYGIGRKTAFLSQQHINAKLAQRHLNSKNLI